MNKYEILVAIKKHVQEEGAWDYPTIEGVEFNQKDSYGGEGEGDTIGVVWEVTPKDLPSFFVQANGHYDSYAGSDYSYCEPCEVIPYEKTITAWKKP